MQPLCSLHVLLLSQGQNWIAPGDCIFPYAWHFGYIMPPHVCLLYIFLPFSSEIFLGNWNKNTFLLSSYFLILLTFLLSIITAGSSILRTFISLICSDTGGLLTTQSRAAWFCPKHGAAFLRVFCLCPRYFSIPQASCCCENWSEYLNKQFF